MSSNKQVIAKLIKQLVLNAGNHRWAEVEELQLTPNGSTIDETIVPLNDTINELWAALGFKEEAPLMTKPDEEESDEEESDEEESDKKEINYEEVYAIVEGVDDLVGNHSHLSQFKTRTDENGIHHKTTYYQTYGGGGEGGYFLHALTLEDGKIVEGVYGVSRSWGTPFKCERLFGKTLYFHKGNEMAGKVNQVCVY